MEQILAEVDIAPGFTNARATRAAAPAQRHNLYAPPHKALRLWFSHVLGAAGRVDPLDDADVAALTEQIRGLVQFCRGHLAKEEEFVHPAMEARRPGSTTSTRDDHLDHVEAFARLESGVRAVESARREQRDGAIAKLYQQFALFVADNLVHMHAEETDNNAVLWGAYSDDELLAIEQRLVASIPQEMKMAAMPWMVPAMNPAERAAFLRGIGASVPPMAFNGILASVQSTLTDLERKKLALALAN